MSWPQIDEFRNAMLTPRNLLDVELSSGEVVKNKLGLPMPWAGGIAIAYKVKAVGKNWAVRLFKAETDHLISYNMISEALNRLPVWSKARSYFTKFKYLSSGIDVPAYRTDPLNPYPIVKMEWVQGQRLDQWVRDHLSDSVALTKLAEKWLAMVGDLHRECLAHGDLQHGNVIVTAGGDLKLIDYDGMFVSLMQGQRARELGHPNWNHHARNEASFGDYLDQFSGFVGYISLHAIAQKPDLFQKYNNGDNLIFTYSDLGLLQNATIYRDLLKLTRNVNGGLSVADMVANLGAWCEAAIDSMTLDEAIKRKKVTVKVGTVYVGARAEIVVKTDPPGAMIKINGTAYGQTDDRNGSLRVSISPGMCRFEISSPGHESLLKQEDLRNARNNDICAFQLKKVAVTNILSIKTHPLGAEVRIEDDFYGITIPGGLSVPKQGLPSTIKVGIRRAGYREIGEACSTEKTDELNYVLEPTRDWSYLTSWIISGLIGTLITLMGIFQVAILMGRALEVLPGAWGVFAFSSGVISVLIYMLLSGQNIKGAPFLLFTSSLAIVLGLPDVILNASTNDPAAFFRAPLILLEKRSVAYLPSFMSEAHTYTNMLTLLGIRYGSFILGLVAGWSLAAKSRMRINPISGTALCMLGGCLIPAAVIYKIGGAELGARAGIIDLSAHSLLIGALPGLALGIFFGAILRTLPASGEKTKSVPWFSVVLLGVSYLYFISSGLMFYSIAGKTAMLALSTTPGNTQVFLDNSSRPVGETDVTGKLTIPVSLRKTIFTFRKEGFEPKSLEYDFQNQYPDHFPKVSLKKGLIR
ncbi:MAG: hypothetical protein WBG50_13325 [Desulfomonilaceae bacterium]